ncbi:MAG: hypothetical protein CSA62_01730 [Planctomycetota bacterium]|nr:MAG: hypothetical protein CSA62_01730 [Planctomycetota bacterium]
MHVHSSRNQRWLSNAYLVADPISRKAALIDSGAPMAPLLAVIESEGYQVERVLLTHHHPDHVQHNREWQERFRVPLCGHPAERELFGHLDIELQHEQSFAVGELRVQALHVPGHTLGQLNFLVEGKSEGRATACVFTGDTLFRGSVGGTRGKGHTTLADLKHSILHILLALPEDLTVYPGHMEPTSIGEELKNNPFVRYWRGETEEDGGQVRAYEREAILLVDALDYDGGRKCQLRFTDDQSEDLVPGSKVTRLD